MIFRLKKVALRLILALAGSASVCLLFHSVDTSGARNGEGHLSHSEMGFIRGEASGEWMVDLCLGKDHCQKPGSNIVCTGLRTCPVDDLPESNECGIQDCTKVREGCYRCDKDGDHIKDACLAGKKRVKKPCFTRCQCLCDPAQPPYEYDGKQYLQCNDLLGKHTIIWAYDCEKAPEQKVECTQTGDGS